MSELDQDFEKVAEQINAKIKEATAALSEANELAKKAGLPSLIYTQYTSESMEWFNRNAEQPLSKDALRDKIEDIQAKLEYISVHSFENELGQAGWATSSSYC